MNYTMIKSIFTITITAAVAGISGLPAVKASPADLNKTQMVQQRDSLDEDYRSFKAKAQEEIHKNELRIAELRAKIDREKAEFRARHRDDLNKLEAKNNKLKRKLSEYKQDTKEGWRRFKDEFNHDMKSLGNSLKDFVTDNK
jgi:peptidoglycan hydrolase CwlO-like protein